MTHAYLWTHRLRGCLFLQRLSSERCPAAPSSAQHSERGTGESWWLKDKRDINILSRCNDAGNCPALLVPLLVPPLSKKNKKTTGNFTHHRAGWCVETTTLRQEITQKENKLIHAHIPSMKRVRDKNQKMLPAGNGHVLILRCVKHLNAALFSWVLLNHLVSASLGLVGVCSRAQASHQIILFLIPFLTLP